jgi:hypothetical protein
MATIAQVDDEHEDYSMRPSTSLSMLNERMMMTRIYRPMTMKHEIDEI